MISQPSSAKLGAAVDQLPFALSTLLNDAAFNARQVLVQQTWPRSVRALNPNFISAALRVEPPPRAR